MILLIVEKYLIIVSNQFDWRESVLKFSPSLLVNGKSRLTSKTFGCSEKEAINFFKGDSLLENIILKRSTKAKVPPSPQSRPRNMQRRIQLSNGAVK